MIMRPRLSKYRTFNAYCRAMDEWYREIWAELDTELRQISRAK